ncbi:MAG: sugar ABC transporter ATP-binding protein [Spirochaetia bacterium]|jgi:ribose transport system ATP-binding protein
MKSFEATGVKKRYGGVVALHGVDVAFDGPMICGLVGANGSGKTTFARICSGETAADDGTLLIDGTRTVIRSPKEAKRHGIVQVHQHLSLVPELSVWENISLGNESRAFAGFARNRAAKEKARELLAELDISDISIEEKVVSLTSEKKQMVEIAKALLQEPRLLILDEPTAALGYFHVEKLFKKIAELKSRGVSVIFISHRLWEIVRLCDLVYAFSNGRGAGMVDFRSQPRDENLIVPLVTGSNKETAPESPSEIAPTAVEVALELRDVSSEHKVRGVSLKARRGEILGIGGLADQGQEELVLAMSGMLRRTGGAVLLDGREIRLRHPNEAVKNGIFLVPGDRQKDGLFMNLDVFENVVYPRFPMRRGGFFLDIRGLTRVTQEVAGKLGLVPPDPRIIVSNLSGGNQQKVVFAKWLQFTPTILLLNDPAKGIDIQAKTALYSLVKELAKSGTTVILYASAVEELRSNCHRVLIMFEGRIVDEIQGERISDESILKSSLTAGVKNGQ